MYRHGDLLICPVASLPLGAKREKRQGDIVLALGEATGHAHRIATPGAVTFIDNDGRYLVVTGVVELSHEEHATITLPPGTYRIRRQRMYVPGAVPAQVID